MKLVIDTSILIDKLRGGTKWDEFLNVLDDDVELYLPSIVIFEMFSGKSSKKKEITKKIVNFRKYFREIGLTPEIAKRAGEINRDVPMSLDLPDYIIASTAIEIGAQIVTLNKKHFTQIPQVVIYSN